MNLKDWIKAERKAGRDITLGKVADLVGISQANLSRACNHLTVPHLQVVKRVRDITERKVDIDDWKTEKD